MAAADALWYDMSLMHDIGILRPKEAGIYQSKPGFRCKHQLITYSGICRRLDCWQSEVANLDLRLTSLEAFADTKPMFTQLKMFALGRVHQKPGLQHDMQFENALIINKYMLLYEELTHLCIVAWILVFKATGKHKYAAYMPEFLLNIHFMYPAGLWHAVCYSMLVNLSGQ
ncbi:hypothetical protein EDD16DRAFT_1699074 [Pisolithus croceorrhizus]|nr:hypothetical protein EDD16DRAFT_1699074 [Pisolithus croceorrhizus]